MYQNNKTKKAMKKNYAIYSMLAFSMFAASCSQDEELTSNAPVQKQTISISVTDLGMTNADGTRATTDASYVTTFEKDDAIGVFAVNGTVVSDNVKLTYDGSSSWTGNLKTSYDEGTKFYAYYPYTSDLSGFDATNGFTSVISSWDPTSKSSYTAGDLMTSEATEITMNGVAGTLSFELSHAMSMVEITNNSGSTITYNFTNTDLANNPYTVKTSAEELGDIKLGETTLSNTDVVEGKTRVLINPSKTDAISIALGTSTTYKSDALSLTGGKYYTISVGSSSETETKSWELAVGDIMMADGSLRKASGNTDVIGENEKSSAIGIVYYVGDPSPITMYASSYGDYSSCNALANDGFTTCTHGLVIGLSTLSIENNAWGTTAWEESDFLTMYNAKTTYGVLAECSATNVKVRMVGYDNHSVFKKLSEKYSTLVAALKAKEAPSVTSGWYVPSYAEVSLIAKGSLSKASKSESDPAYNVTCSSETISSSLKAASSLTTLWDENTTYMTSTLDFNTSSKKNTTGKVFGYTGGSFAAKSLSESGLSYVIRPALAF